VFCFGSLQCYDIDDNKSALKLDEAERKIMAALGTDTNDFLKFASRDSSNVSMRYFLKYVDINM